MRNLIILLVLLTPLALTALATEAGYTFESSNLEGAVHRFDLTDSDRYGSWEWRNHLTVKASEPLDTLAVDYRRNYLRDRLDLRFTNRLLFIDIYGGIDAYSNENLPSGITGWPGQYRDNLGLLGGIDTELKLGRWFLRGGADFSETRFDALRMSEQDTLLVLPDNPVDRNLSLNGELEYRTHLGMRPYLRADVYNDLNESDAGNVSEYRLGIRYDKKFNPILIWVHDSYLGVSDYHDNMPYFLALSERVSVKLALRWMLVQRVEASFWTDRDFGEAYTGNNFGETMIQRTFGVDKANRVNRVQAGLRYYADGWSALRGALQGHVGRFLAFAEYHRYIGEKLALEDRLEAQAGADLWKLRLTSGIRAEHFSKRPDLHTFLIQLSYLQP